MDYDELFCSLDPYLVGQAQWIAWACQYTYGIPVDWQDLAQASRLYLWQYLERHPGTTRSMLLTLSRLRMYGERQRGRDVLRPHPGKRQRIYERATLGHADDYFVTELDSSSFLTDKQERELLLSLLAQAELTDDAQTEHVVVLALRRFARALGDQDLYSQAHQQWLDWWRRQRRM